MSEKSGILITLIVIMLMFNFIYAVSNPDVTNNIVLDSLIGLITGSVVTGIISGITLFGSGLNSESVRIIFGITSFMNILFKINLSGYQIGLGLGRNMIDAFPVNAMAGIPYFTCWLLVITVFILGVMMLIE
jgi:hypothetical protein